MKMNYKGLMEEAIDYARKHNPSRPYASLIVDESGNILAKAVNSFEQNPIYHGEIVAINLLVKNFAKKVTNDLILVTTGEPCTMCMSAIYWNNMSNKKIKYVVFGATIATLQDIWKDQINMTAEELNLRCPKNKQVSVIGPVLEEKCTALFRSAKNLQNQV